MAEAKDIITQTVTSWTGITTGPHRFGGLEYLLGKTEIGHLHGSRLLDIAFSKEVRDALVTAGHAAPHHIAPETGWISFWLKSEADSEHAVWLLRLSYLRHLLLLRRRRQGLEGDLAGIDLDAAIDDLKLAGELQSVFTILLAKGRVGS
jgi:hypothetical protein